MKRVVTFFIVFFLLANNVFALQNPTIRLRIKSEKYNTFYFASNLNGWNPSDEKYKFQRSNLGYELSLEVPSIEILSYKITRGNWNFVQCDKRGKDVANNVIECSKILKDTLIELDIDYWKDEFASIPKLSTASKNVSIISEEFYLEKLGKKRRVWIYLPSSYHTSKKSYPVLYMHDGQNLFDEITAPFGEWGVDECLDSLKLNLIVVGIDNGVADRLSEYSPYDFKVKPDEINVWDVKGTGGLYLESLVKDLKPYIDQNYRTKKSKKYTSICGSSMGGLISFYAMMRYPEIFGSAGVFSPAFWTNMKDLKEELMSNKNTNWKGNIYFIAGELEGKKYIDNMYEIERIVKKSGKENIEIKVISGGQHNEKLWRSEIPNYLKWLIN